MAADGSVEIHRTAFRCGVVRLIVADADGVAGLQPRSDRLLILDFGSQYAQLIARRVREAGVYSEIHPWDMDVAAIRAFAPSGVILSGGTESVTIFQGPRADPLVFELGVPVLGICYRMQTMAAQLGGEVAGSSHREFGYAEVTLRNDPALLQGLADTRDDSGAARLKVWMSHGDRVERLPAARSARHTPSSRTTTSVGCPST